MVSRPLTVLHVAYPLARVGPDEVGGAEQVLSCLDRALVEAGHRSIVVACKGSVVAGTLVEGAALPDRLDEAAIAAGRHAHGATVERALRQHPGVDVVHLHGIDFDRYLPPPGPPALVTLHAPFDWYSAEALRPGRSDTFLHCVSDEQHAAAPSGLALLPPIANGVPVAALQARHAKRGFALVLGRIAPEKGVHLALEAAHRAGLPLLVAGELFPYDEHRRYFDREVAPRLDRMRRLVGPAGFARKRRLLTAARCLVLPARDAETSSLVAREALACGTPVVATPVGALPRTIRHGRTGFLVEGVDALAGAMRDAASLDPEECRAEARARFDVAPMIAAYLRRYGALRDGDPALA